MAELRGGERQGTARRGPEPGADESMRLDRFLWFVRLAKSRVLAQAMAAEGRLRIDGRRIDRAHAAVRVGNILTFFRAGSVRVVRIESLPQRRGPPTEAQACYRDLDMAPDGGNQDANESQEGAGN